MLMRRRGLGFSGTTDHAGGVGCRILDELTPDAMESAAQRAHKQRASGLNAQRMF
jgi:hypothetical protein